jgi:hypothetical protein
MWRSWWAGLWTSLIDYQYKNCVELNSRNLFLNSKMPQMFWTISFPMLSLPDCKSANLHTLKVCCYVLWWRLHVFSGGQVTFIK